MKEHERPRKVERVGTPPLTMRACVRVDHVGMSLSLSANVHHRSPTRPRHARRDRVGRTQRVGALASSAPRALRPTQGSSRPAGRVDTWPLADSAQRVGPYLACPALAGSAPQLSALARWPAGRVGRLSARISTSQSQRRTDAAVGQPCTRQGGGALLTLKRRIQHSARHAKPPSRLVAVSGG